MSVKNVTFEQLKAILLERAGLPDMPSKAIAANVVSALAEFLREREIPATQVIGSTLRMSFYGERDKHLATLRAASKSVAYVKNRSSLLSHWHRLIRTLDHEGASLDGTVTPLQEALQKLMEGRPLKPTAKKIGMSPTTLTRWLQGALPRAGTEHHLKRLEEFAELAPGALIDLLPYNALRNFEPANAAPTIEYRIRLALQSRDRYRLRPQDALPTFRTEWRALIAYKTSAPTGRPQPNRKAAAVTVLRTAMARKKGVASKQWRAVYPTEDLLGDRWVDVIDDRLCRTAAINFDYAACFIGWAQRSKKKDGLGLTPKAAQTLGLLLDTKKLEAFIEWRVERSGEINSWPNSFYSFVGMLCHPDTGFLVGRPDIGARSGFSATAWAKRCAATHEWIGTARSNLTDVTLVTRDPKAALKASLDLPMPLDNFILGVKRLETRRPSTGGEEEAIWARDLLMLALMMSNPLRIRNFKELTYFPDNRGQLRKTPAGEWRIVIERANFKNFAGAAKHKDYDKKVDPAVWPYIERYVQSYRATLGGKMDLVFVSSETPDREWPKKGMNRRFEILTRRYVPDCPGVGPQAFRHLIASSIIIKNGDLMLAADTLHDKQATVEEHYKHLLSSVGDRGRTKALGETFAKVAARPGRTSPKEAAA